MQDKETVIWDLHDIITRLVAQHPQIVKIYLFGSRAYNTGSRRSDIDLLVYSQKAIQSRELTDWIHDEFPPVDVFKTVDMRLAESVINGSVLQCSGKEELVKKLDAIELWNSATGFNEKFARWQQLSDRGIEFTMTVAGIKLPKDPMSVIGDYYAALHRDGELPVPKLWTNWRELGHSIVEIVRTALHKPSKFATRARYFSFEKIKLADEYDFQNLIHLLLRPLLPTIEPETVAIILDGSEKKADFSLEHNRIIIEAKHIRDSSTKNTVVKTLSGLSDFYASNPNVKLLIFLVLYDSSVTLDKTILDAHYGRVHNTPPIVVSFIENSYGNQDESV